MIPDRLLIVEASLVKAGTAVDAYGNDVPAWDAVTATPIRCRLEQATRSETTDETRDALVGTFRLFTNDLTVQGRDRIVVGLTTYEVDGPPALVADGAGTHHLEATLRWVEG